MTTWKLETTVPVYEFVEACGVISTEEKSLVYTAGEKGVVKIWDWKTGKTLSSVHVDALKKHSVSDIM